MLNSQGVIMKKFLLLLSVVLLWSFSFYAEDATNEEDLLDVNVEEISKAFGHLIGKNLDMPGFKFDLNSIIEGIQDAVAGKPSPMTEEEYEVAITKIQDRTLDALAKTNLEQANTFMKENSQAESIIEVEPGKIQYLVVKNGEGAEVQKDSSPLIHYTGTFINGAVFGSTFDNDEPITLPLNQAIPGFSKGIEGMREGEQRTIYIHPDLGYGTSSHLPPNSLLVFNVEVIKADNEEIASKDETENIDAR